MGGEWPKGQGRAWLDVPEWTTGPASNEAAWGSKTTTAWAVADRSAKAATASSGVSKRARTTFLTDAFVVLVSVSPRATCMARVSFCSFSFFRWANSRAESGRKLNKDSAFPVEAASPVSSKQAIAWVTI